VARQYCGSLGKVDNCQVGVALGYAGAEGYGLVDYKLYMPEQWFDGQHAEQRKKCKVPSSVKFRTKNEILSEMIRSAAESGLFPAKYVGVDSAYGSDCGFLDSLPEGLVYFADVKGNTTVFKERPSVSVPQYKGSGKRPTIKKPGVPPLSVKEAAELEGIPWNKTVLGIGAKGPIIAEDKIIRVIEVRDGLPGKDVWLYVRKLENGKIKYALCNAPEGSPPEEIRKPALMRWSIEQCFRECKDYLGMDHYETRSWGALHRHMLLTFIAHLFITKLRIAFSGTPHTPCVTPFTETPVEFEDYLMAFEQMRDGKPIRHPDIMVMPTKPQQFMTIGLVQKLVCATFVKIGAVMGEIDYLLYKARSAFDSHSTTKMNDAIAAYCNIP
jgi:SRSO17 transposase